LKEKMGGRNRPRTLGPPGKEGGYDSVILPHSFKELQEEGAWERGRKQKQRGKGPSASPVGKLKNLKKEDGGEGKSESAAIREKTRERKQNISNALI